MNNKPGTDIGVDSIMVEAPIAEQEALNGTPNFYDLPEELTEAIEKATLTVERMFWLRAGHIKKDAVTTTLLRRAVYAEQRCWEMENRLGEVSLIAQGMKDEIERLKQEINTIAGHTG